MKSEFNANKEVEKMLNADEKYSLWKKGVEYGIEHSQPSPETRERLAKLETNQNNLMQEIQEIKQMIKDLDSKVSCALDKKAGKWVEDVIKWVGYAIGASIVGFITWFISTGMQFRK